LNPEYLKANIKNFQYLKGIREDGVEIPLVGKGLEKEVKK
jgi:hypothetical protein